MKWKSDMTNARMPVTYVAPLYCNMFVKYYRRQVGQRWEQQSRKTKNCNIAQKFEHVHKNFTFVNNANDVRVVWNEWPLCRQGIWCLSWWGGDIILEDSAMWLQGWQGIP
jgi:hypothetical protein